MISILFNISAVMGLFVSKKIREFNISLYMLDCNIVNIFFVSFLDLQDK